jgi:excisionase family DNA binding protein
MAMSLAFNFDRYLTVGEVGEIIKKRKSTVYNLLKSGELDAVKIGGGNRIPERALQKYLEACRPVRSENI